MCRLHSHEPQSTRHSPTCATMFDAMKPVKSALSGSFSKVIVEQLAQLLKVVFAFGDPQRQREQNLVTRAPGR